MYWKYGDPDRLRPDIGSMFVHPPRIALLGMNEAHAVIVVDGKPTTIDAATLQSMWSGQAYVLWRDFEGLGPTFARGARGVAVARLQRLLRRAGTFDGAETGVFDPATETAVVRFQRDHRLGPDGIVGPLTRIVLYGVAGEHRPPTLAAREGGAA